MARPSIFSKDYERLMRKRRRRIIVSLLAILIIGSGTAVYIYNGGINFSQIKENLQTWVDGGKEIVEEDSLLTVAPEAEEPKLEEPKEEFFETVIDEMNIKISLNITEDGTKTFNEVVTGENVIISPDKTKFLVTDTKQNLFIINVNDEITDITKPNYVSTTGSTYTKESILNQYQGYVWHKSAKFISDTKIAYVSNLPYFGSGISEYIWVYDIESGQHITKWEIKSNEISLGEISEKGLEIHVDGKIKYITVDANIVD